MGKKKSMFTGHHEVHLDGALKLHSVVVTNMICVKKNDASPQFSSSA